MSRYTIVMSIHQFFKQDDDSNYFHSNSYAKVAHGEQLGATSVQSFTERYRIDRNRKMVNRYHDSMVARKDSVVNGVTKSQANPLFGSESGRSSGVSRQDVNTTTPARPISASMPSRVYREPPTRSYNPYG
jgi:hypothetical protein